MTEPLPPYDEPSEVAVLGAMLLAADILDEVLTTLTADDFYLPGHRFVFTAIETLHSEGSKIDPVLVAEELDRLDLLADVGGPGVLIDLQAGCPATSNASAYAGIVAQRANARRLIGECDAAIDAAYDLKDPEEVRDRLESALSSITTPQSEAVKAQSIDEFMKNYQEADRDESWIVDGLLKEQWRCVVVAGEGGGKSVLMRQFALAAAQGINPFTLNPLDVGKVPTLIVDCENPDDSIFEVCQPITARLERWFETGRSLGEYEEGSAWLYHKPEGVNLRSRVDLAKLDAVISSVKPKLVVAGPLYKMYDEASGDGVHTAMRATLRALDKLRTRHGFALMLEHHAPHGHAGSRDMRPEGSSLLLRWPELGIGMTPHKDRGQQSKTHVKLTRWRNDRSRNSWPLWIRRELEMSDDHMPWRAAQEPRRNDDFEGAFDDDER